MLLPIFENRFKKDIKRLQKRGKDMTKLKNVIDKLLQKQELEPKYKDHALMGNWNGYRDCHLEPDWLLIYKITDTHLFLVRSGSHRGRGSTGRFISQFDLDRSIGLW